MIEGGRLSHLPWRRRERGKEEGTRLLIGVSLHDLVKTWFDIVERAIERRLY